jgi:hypothetical protein
MNYKICLGKNFKYQFKPVLASGLVAEVDACGGARTHYQSWPATSCSRMGAFGGWRETGRRGSRPAMEERGGMRTVVLAGGKTLQACSDGAP